MEIINTLVLIATAIISLLNLLVEIEDKTTIKHEAFLKIIFGGIAVLCLSSIGISLPILYFLFNVSLLVLLSLRLHARLKVF